LHLCDQQQHHHHHHQQQQQQQQLEDLLHCRVKLLREALLVFKKLH
jgi:hypothetical protein